MLRYLSGVLPAIFIMHVTSGCEKSETPSVRAYSQNENVLRYDVAAPFTSLNPADVEFSGSTVIFPLLYSYLFVPDADGKLEPDLASRWTYDPRNYGWTIYLSKGARFHNKAPVTAKDVKFSLENVLKKNRPYLFSLIERIVILSDSAIYIELKYNDPQFLTKIWDMEIIPEPSKVESDLRNNPVGSGPFQFKYRKGDREVGLVANKDYFQGRPSLEGITFHFEPDKEEAWTRILSDKTDIVQEISPKNYEMMRQYEKKYYFDLYPLRYYTILLYNTTDPLFSDPRVRLALTYAIDREYIVNKILRGLGKAAVGPMGVDSPFHDPAVKPIPYNPQKGLEILKEAGWSYDKEGRYLVKDGRRFEFTLLVFEEGQIEMKVARYLQISLNDLGIRVQLESLPFEEMKRRYYRNNAFQAVLTELNSVGQIPELLIDTWSSDTSSKSVAGAFEHPELTHLIRQALAEKDPSKQRVLLYKIDGLIMSLQPGTFLFHKTAIDVMSRRFKLPSPFSLKHEGIYRLRYASLDREYRTAQSSLNRP